MRPAKKCGYTPFMFRDAASNCGGDFRDRSLTAVSSVALHAAAFGDCAWKNPWETEADPKSIRERSNARSLLYLLTTKRSWQWTSETVPIDGAQPLQLDDHPRTSRCHFRIKKKTDQHSLADIHSQHPSKISAFRLTTRNAKE